MYVDKTSCCLLSPNNKLPLLNSQVWIEDTDEGPQVRYEHYQKPMASSLEIQEISKSKSKERLKITDYD